MNSDLEQKIQKLWIIQECRNHMSKYQYLHSAKKHQETYELFALEREDCWIENYDLGFFYGSKSIKRFFVDFHEKMDGTNVSGSFCQHDLTTEVIVVADDLKTVKACWMSPGCETRREPEAGKLTSYWVWVKYAVDFILENGKWKFWHFTIFSDFCSDYYTAWVDMKYITPATPDLLDPDDSSVIKLAYTSKKAPELWPVPPVAYTTYDGNTMTPRKA